MVCSPFAEMERDFFACVGQCDQQLSSVIHRSYSHGVADSLPRLHMQCATWALLRGPALKRSGLLVLRNNFVCLVSFSGQLQSGRAARSSEAKQLECGGGALEDGQFDCS